jgi:hypothetical protein
MTEDNNQTNSPAPEFDFAAYPPNTLFHDRRNGRERRTTSPGNGENSAPTKSRGRVERRARKERRRRIDPTTFEKQYSDDEMEFMSAMQRFKELTGKSFPSHGDVIRVAVTLGYRRAVFDLEPSSEELPSESTPAIQTSRVEN